MRALNSEASQRGCQAASIGQRSLSDGGGGFPGVQRPQLNVRRIGKLESLSSVVCSGNCRSLTSELRFDDSERKLSLLTGFRFLRFAKAESWAVRLHAAGLWYLLVFTCLVFTACRKEESVQATAMEGAPVEVAVVQVRSEPFSSTVPITGTLVSLAAVDVKAETAGRVIRFDRMEGDPVRAGETVVWLDRERAELALRQAETTVQVAEATLARTRIIESYNCQELERARNLVTSGGITDRDLKAASVTEQEGHAQVNLAKAQLDQAQALLAAAQKQVRDCQVQAPVSGMIQKKVANPGAYVEAQAVLFSLVDNRKLELEAPVASSDLAPIKPGQKVSFWISSYGEEAFDGRVREISPAVDSASRAAFVRIPVDNRCGKLKAGMFAQGEILVGTQPEAVTVPMSAVYRDDTSSDRAFTYVVENDKAVRRTVRLGQERSLKFQVSEGLKPGDLVISERSIELAEGVRVKVK